MLTRLLPVCHNEAMNENAIVAFIRAGHKNTVRYHVTKVVHESERSWIVRACRVTKYGKGFRYADKAEYKSVYILKGTETVLAENVSVDDLLAGVR